MAESIGAKAERYSRGEFTNGELKVMLGGMVADQIIDVATFGRLSKLKGKALQKIVWPLVRGAGRAAPMVGRALLPPIAGPAALAYGLYETAKAAADQGRRDAEQGFQIPIPLWNPILGDMPTISGEPFLEALSEVGPPPSPGIGQPAFMERLRPSPRKKRASKFNSAIKAGMAAVKKSTSYGGKGKIKPATKVFSIVTKLASAKKKKKKAPKSGIRRKIWNAMKGLR